MCLTHALLPHIITTLDEELAENQSYNMAITILPPVVEDIRPNHADSDDSMSDSDSDVEMSGVSQAHDGHGFGSRKIGTGVVTPGEVVTDEPQWMR